MKTAAVPYLMLALVLALHANAQSALRFGVLGLFHPHQLEISPVGAQALLIDGLPEPRILNGETGKRHLLVGVSGDNILVGNFRVTQLRASARDGSPTRFKLAVPGKLQRIYAGTLSITASHGELTAVVTMDREVAVATIVASEMPRDAPIEALKAQAVVARSFLLAGPRHTRFDFCDTTHCQYLRSPDEVTPRVQSAVRATNGLVITWHSKIIPTLYARRCGGRTRTLRDTGMDPGDGYPYYSVECKWCHEHPIRWQSRITAGTQPPDPGSESARIAYDRQWGWGALPGDSFSVQHDRAGTLVSGHNIGHGLGMCQLGAIGMAAAGADFRSIVAHYYPNTDLVQLAEDHVVEPLRPASGTD